MMESPAKNNMRTSVSKVEMQSTRSIHAYQCVESIHYYISLVTVQQAGVPNTPGGSFSSSAVV
jgi:hypothetical protein